jgi:hypothetical protein
MKYIKLHHVGCLGYLLSFSTFKRLAGACSKLLFLLLSYLFSSKS